MRTKTLQGIWDALHFIVILLCLGGIFVLSYTGKDSSGLSAGLSCIVVAGGYNLYRMRSGRSSNAMVSRDKTPD